MIPRECERDPAVLDDPADGSALDSVPPADFGDFRDKSGGDRTRGPRGARLWRFELQTRDGTGCRAELSRRQGGECRVANGESQHCAGNPGVATVQKSAATGLPPSTILIGRPIGVIISLVGRP